MSGGFAKSQAWLDLLERPGTFVSFDTIRRLDGPDFADLLREYTEGGTAAARVAFQILRTVATRKAELPAVPWTPVMQEAFARQLGEMVRGHFVQLQPWPRASGDSTGYLWARLDTESCVEFFAARPLEAMAESLQEEAIRILASLSRDHSVCRQMLEAIVEGGGDRALRARDALEDVGIITPERLEAWGRRWREERAPDALDWLYDRWLSYLPVGYPLKDLMAILGPADDGELPDIYYRTPEGHVYIEAYASSGFSGCHRT